MARETPMAPGMLRKARRSRRAAAVAPGMSRKRAKYVSVALTRQSALTLGPAAQGNLNVAPLSRSAEAFNLKSTTSHPCRAPDGQPLGGFGSGEHHAQSCEPNEGGNRACQIVVRQLDGTTPAPVT